MTELEVRSPYSGEVVGTVPLVTPAEVDAVMARAERAAQTTRTAAAHERAAVLHRAAELVATDQDALAAIITAEQGKHTGEAAAEAGRIAGILHLCAEEACRLDGEVIPMDAAPVGEGRLGFTRPEPAGVVLAITPFNYPAILVTHKIGPALAAGNAVVLKPAGATPLTARFLVDRLHAAGVHPDALQCVTGRGAELGAALCADHRRDRPRRRRPPPDRRAGVQRRARRARRRRPRPRRGRDRPQRLHQRRPELRLHPARGGARPRQG